MGAYTTITASNASFTSGATGIKTAFGQSSNVVSLDTYSTAYRFPRLSASNLSINSYYKNLGYWHVSLGDPIHTDGTRGWGGGITGITLSVGGNSIVLNSSGGYSFTSGTAWHTATSHSSYIYVFAAASYTTFTVTATVESGFTFWGWSSGITGMGAIISYSNPATITASEYTNLRPQYY